MSQTLEPDRKYTTCGTEAVYLKRRGIMYNPLKAEMSCADFGKCVYATVAKCIKMYGDCIQVRADQQVSVVKGRTGWREEVEE